MVAVVNDTACRLCAGPLLRDEARRLKRSCNRDVERGQLFTVCRDARAEFDLLLLDGHHRRCDLYIALLIPSDRFEERNISFYPYNYLRLRIHSVRRSFPRGFVNLERGANSLDRIGRLNQRRSLVARVSI